MEYAHTNQMQVLNSGIHGMQGMNMNGYNNQVSNINDDINLSGNDHLYPNETHEEKQRRQRRSKNVNDGRDHHCEVCGKNYLSRPALSQHIKTKHEDRISDFIKGRGRPKRSEGEGVKPKQTTSNVNVINYADDIKRKKHEDEDYNYLEAFKESIRELFLRFGSILNPQNKDVELNLLLNLNLNDSKTTDGKYSYDHVIHEYLKDMSQKLSLSYFKFACKFNYLFRECFNLLKKTELNIDDYSSTNSPDDVPDKCNEFITEFMENNNYFELDSNEIIEIIQHFCLWLYEKGFTQSVLSLA